MTSIEKDIYGVISYFSFFGYPVTAFEVWKWQWRPEKTWSLGEVTQALHTSSWLKRNVNMKDGHYGIGDVAAQLVTRHEHYLDAVAKYKKLRHVLAYVARIPSVQGVALCNTLPFHFTRPNSDIDLFIIAEHGKLWSTRLMTVLPMLLLRQRPGESQQSPVDMSFFVARSALALQEFTLEGDDPYFSFWIQNLVPVYESDPGIFRALIAENAWAKSELPASVPIRRSRSAHRRIRGVFPALVSERLAERVSRKRLPKHLLEAANENSCVVITQDVLKFHSTDRRKEIRDHLATCLDRLG